MSALVNLFHVTRIALLMGLIFYAVGCGGERTKPPSPEKTPWLFPDEQIKLLRSKDYRIRTLAAVNLGRMGANAAKAIPELEKISNDNNPKVRKAVLEALEKIRAANDP